MTHRDFLQKVIIESGVSSEIAYQLTRAATRLSQIPDAASTKQGNIRVNKAGYQKICSLDKNDFWLFVEGSHGTINIGKFRFNERGTILVSESGWKDRNHHDLIPRNTKFRVEVSAVNNVFLRRMEDDNA